MRTYDAWFPRYALGNSLMFFCRVFSPAVGRGSSTLSTFLDRRMQRVKQKYSIQDILDIDYTEELSYNRAAYSRDSYSTRILYFISLVLLFMLSLAQFRAPHKTSDLEQYPCLS